MQGMGFFFSTTADLLDTAYLLTVWRPEEDFTLDACVIHFQKQHFLYMGKNRSSWMMGYFLLNASLRFQIEKVLR